MIGYYCKCQTYDGIEEKYSRLAKTIKTWLLTVRPLCWECTYVQYVSDKGGRYHAIKTIRNVRENEIFPKLINRDDLISFIDLARNCKSTQISEIIAGTRFTEDFAYRCRSELEKVKVLKTFHPELPVIDIDFDKVRIWELYGYSDNWYIYYRSDDIRKRYAERGVNFDEIDLVDDEVDE